MIRNKFLLMFMVLITPIMAIHILLEKPAHAAPAAIDAWSFSLSSDMASLAPAVESVAAELGSRHRTVAQVMDSANRDRMPLCNSSVYSAAASRSGSGLKGFCWNDGDDSVDYWYPQGITTTHDAYTAGLYQGRQIVLNSWYHKPENEADGSGDKKGVRVTFTDWDSSYPNKYRHVLLVEPVVGGNFKIVPVHAGGIMWYGDLLYVADTHNGFRIFDMRRIYEVNTSVKTVLGRHTDGNYYAYGYRYVMLQVGSIANIGAKLRYSFVSLDRATTPDSLVVGEYANYISDGNGNQILDGTTRVVRFPLNYKTRLPKTESDGYAYASEAFDTDFGRMQGVLARNGRFWFASSNTSSKAGYLRFWKKGTTTVRKYTWALGCEDLSYWPDPDHPDRIWTLTEYPDTRVVISVPQADWD